MSNHPKNTNSTQTALFTAGKFELGEAANVLPDHMVRRAGLKRYGRAILLGVGVPVAAIGLSLLAAEGVQHLDDERRKALPEVNANDQNADGIPDGIPADVRHVFEPGENPYTVAEKFNVKPGDTLDMANRIQGDLADSNGNVHPGDVAQITPAATDHDQ